MTQSSPPESVLEQTVEMLYHDDPPMRMRAVLKLAQIGEPAVPHLVEALHHNDLDVRLRAAQTLVKMKDERGTVALLDLVRDMEDPDIEFAVSERSESYTQYLLERTVDGLAVEHLIAALDEPEVSVRSTAARLLGKIGDVRAVEPLIIKLDDDDPGVHLAAVRALGQMGDKRAVVPLINALRHAEMRDDQFWEERLKNPYFYADFPQTTGEAIIEALEQIGTPGAVLAARSWLLWSPLDSLFNQTRTQEKIIIKALKRIGVRWRKR